MKHFYFFFLFSYLFKITFKKVEHKTWSSFKFLNKLIRNSKKTNINRKPRTILNFIQFCNANRVSEKCKKKTVKIQIL